MELRKLKIISNILEQAAKIAEEQVDAKLSQLNEMDEDELEKLKEKRLEALKKAQKQKQEWLAKGHGEYREIASEKDFFGEVKESKNVVCHFYKSSTFSGAGSVFSTSQLGSFSTIILSFALDSQRFD
uniref:Thioredoxin domain containing 9 n=1 Tax=Oryzias latipes TaxID=8090 RepID=A0A3B3IBP4_ORYLA